MAATESTRPQSLNSPNSGWASSRRRRPSRRGERTPLNLPESRRLTASCGRRQPLTTTPSKPDCPFHESIIAATNNRFYQPLGALVRTALSLTAPIANAIFGHAVGDLAAHGEVLLAIERKDEQRAFDLMRGLLSHVAREVAEVESLPPLPDRRPVAAAEK